MTITSTTTGPSHFPNLRTHCCPAGDLGYATFDSPLGEGYEDGPIAYVSRPGGSRVPFYWWQHRSWLAEEIPLGPDGYPDDAVSIFWPKYFTGCCSWKWMLLDAAGLGLPVVRLILNLVYNRCLCGRLNDEYWTYELGDEATPFRIRSAWWAGIYLTVGNGGWWYADNLAGQWWRTGQLVDPADDESENRAMDSCQACGNEPFWPDLAPPEMSGALCGQMLSDLGPWKTYLGGEGGEQTVDRPGPNRIHLARVLGAPYTTFGILADFYLFTSAFLPPEWWNVTLDATEFPGASP